MAGKERPKCAACGKFYKFDWDMEIFKPQCECEEVLFDSGYAC